VIIVQSTTVEVDVFCQVFRAKERIDQEQQSTSTKSEETTENSRTDDINK